MPPRALLATLPMCLLCAPVLAVGQTDAAATLALRAELADAPLAGYVLVWRGAPVFSSAAEARAFEGSVDALVSMPDLAVAFRLMEDAGDVVRLQSVDGQAEHCDNASFDSTFTDYRLEVWVRREHLAPVLAEPVEQRFEDGTYRRLEPGLLVVREASSALRATAPDVLTVAGWAMGHLLPGPVDAEAVGLSYQRSGGQEQSGPFVDDESPVELSDARLDGQGVGLPSYYAFDVVEPGVASDGGAEGEATLFRVRGGCFELGVRARVARRASGPLPLSGGVGLGTLCADTADIAAGATVFTEAGDPIGQARGDTHYCGAPPMEVGELLCFERRLSPHTTGRLCHQRGDVEVSRSGAGMLGLFDGPGGLGGGTGATASPDEPPTVAGYVSREAIREVIERHGGDFHACYEQVLTFQPTAAGRVATEFTIREDGRVDDALVTSSDLPAIEACLLTELRRLQFPAPPIGMVLVHYPFRFVPEE